MGLIPTLVGLAVSIAVVLTMGILERRPPQIGRVRLIPYLAIMFLGIVCTLLFLAHLLTLLGGGKA